MAINTKIGIVGTGRMGVLHLSKFQSLSEVDLVGIYEPNLERAKELSEKYSIKVFKSLEELIFNVEGLVIASPTPTHFPIAKTAMEMGCHVLIEKPFCETVEEALQLEAMAQTKKIVCQVGFLERFRLEALMGPYSIPSRSRLQSHRLSRGVGRELSVDVVSDLMIHDVDLVLSIAQEEPVNISAAGFSFVTDYLDFATARLEFANGMIADLTANRVSSVQERTLQAVSKGYSCEFDFISNTKFSLAELSGDKHITQPISFDALEVQARNFVESIQGKARPKVTAKEGARVISVISKIRQIILGYETPLLFTKQVESSVAVREH